MMTFCVKIFEGGGDSHEAPSYGLIFKLGETILLRSCAVTVTTICNGGRLLSPL